jgi:hypothetical protein
VKHFILGILIGIATGVAIRDYLYEPERADPDIRIRIVVKDPVIHNAGYTVIDADSVEIEGRRVRREQNRISSRGSVSTNNSFAK